MKKILSSALVAGMLLGVGVTTSLAMGGPSGPKTDYPVPGKIGEVIVNPYKIAPLTAIIRNGGYELKDIKVTIVPKENGKELSYKVSDAKAKGYGGIPIWGLYPDYYNTINVEYTKIHGSKQEKIKETYHIYAAPIYTEVSGTPDQKGSMFSKIEVKKVADKYKDRLYLINHVTNKSGQGTRVVWNNPMGGAIEWNFYPQNFIIDTAGDVRWYIFANPIYDFDKVYGAGVMMGFKQNPDGQLTFGYGQRYAKYDLMGKESFNRQLPLGYNDFSHSFDVSPKGNYFLRVGSSNTKRLDGKNVRTVRDVIIEVDPTTGDVVDDWRLYEILDPYRDVVFKTLDQGAVCLNIDANLAGQTLSDEDLAKLDDNDKFGDIIGSGAGRNWAHVNSVDHDAEDDSIILSSRHQSAIIKIGRDKQVKWILGSPEGWSDKFKDKLLTPVDNKGNKIVCEANGSKCPGYLNEKGGFDYTWTQHTAFKIDAKSKGDILYVTAFDNGDGRGMEQPALPSMKYSRGVIYKVDQKKMTVEQVWEYGKNRGHDFYSPVTSITEYHADKDSILMYSATAGGAFDFDTGAFASLPNPTLLEFDYLAKEPSVEIQIFDTNGYQAIPINLQKAFK